MIFLSTIIACLMIGGGASAMFIGAGMIVLERGWSMVIAGSIIATGGVVLLGIVMVLRELQRLPDRIAEVLPEAIVMPEASSDETESHYYPKVFADIHEPRVSPREAREEVSAKPSKVESILPNFDKSSNFYELEEPSVVPPGLSPKVEKKVEVITPVVDAPAARPYVRRDIKLPQEPPHTSFQHLAPTSGASHEEPTLNEEVAQSALKIQISLHGASVNDSPRATFDPIPIVQNTMDQQPLGSLFSKIGRGRKARNATPPVPPGPTAADLARERLALADTPIDEAEEAEETEEIAAKIITDSDVALANAAEKDAGHLSVNVSQTVEAPLPSMGGAEVSRSPAPELRAADIKSEPTVARVPDERNAALAASEEQPPPSTDEGQRNVVGSYQAGANVYVMYDDGTIEAETPRGIFRFNSLDSLKSYIASGEDPSMAGSRVERAPTVQS